MRIPIIKVRSKDRHEHIVGEDIHDTLYIDEKGALQYLNAHCCEGTGFPEEGYAFVGMGGDGEGSLTGRPEVEFVTLDQLIEIEAEHLKKQVNQWAKLRRRIDEESRKIIVTAKAGIKVSDDTEGNKATVKKDIPLIDPIVCPVEPSVFLTATPEIFMFLMKGVIAIIRSMNEKGNLRMMVHNQNTCDDIRLYEFNQRIFNTDAERIIYAACIHSHGLFDPDPEYESKIEAAYPLLTKIIVKGDADVINNMAHDEYDRPYLAAEIKRLIKRHYYSDDMISRIEDTFETYIHNNKEKRKKDKEEKKTNYLAALRAEGKVIYEKYGVQFEYGYAVHVKLRYGREIMTDNRWYDSNSGEIEPGLMFFAKLVPDKDYSKRKAKFENIAAQIDSARATAGNRTIMNYYIHNSQLKEFMNDSRLTRKENPDKKTVAYIDKDQENVKKPLSHWTLIDVACCDDTLFTSVIEAMREYIKEKGLNVTLP